MIRTHSCGELSAKQDGQEVTLCGWINSIRQSGKIAFIDLRDREGKTQVFLGKDLAEQAAEFHKEDVVMITGIVKKRPESQIKGVGTGEIELNATTVELLAASDTPLPIELSEETTTSIDKRIDNRFLDLRRDSIKAIFQVRSAIYAATIDFFVKSGFVNIQTPKLTASGVESGAEEFKIPYFGKQASLAQSPQVYKQMFVVSGLEKVFEIGTVFRAENSHTTRHLTEFTGIDFEMGFISGPEDVMDVIEKYLIHLTNTIRNTCQEQLAVLGVTIDPVTSIPRISLHEVRKWLSEQGKVIALDDDPDAEAEKMIGKIVKEKFGSDFVFLLDYPWQKRPFYHMRPDGDKTTTKSFDLVYKGVEIATGAQREHRLEVLEAQCEEKGLNLEKLGFYRDIFRFGVIPHGGVGMGLDRIVARMLNLENVREAILLPRDPERLTP